MSSIFPYLKFSFFLVLLMACGNNSNSEKELSLHNQIRQEEEKLKEEHKTISDLTEDVYEKNKDLLENFREKQNSDSSALAQLIEQETTSLQYLSTLEKHNAFFAQHADFQKLHEKTALSPNEINAQHTAMRNNILAISSELNKIKNGLRKIQEQQSQQEELLASFSVQ